MKTKILANVIVFWCSLIDTTLQLAVGNTRPPALHPRTVNVTVPYGTYPNNATTYSIVLTGFEECDENSNKYGTSVNWRKWIVDGFTEHDTMSMGEWKWEPQQHIQVWAYPDVHWKSAAAIEYFGPAYKNEAYRDRIQANLDQHANMDYAWFLGWHLHVRCDDPANECMDKDTGFAKRVNTEAYTIHHDDDDSCSPYENHINFCPKYFKLPELDNALSVAAGYRDRRNFLRVYWNRACVWAHEVMHVSWLASPVGTGQKYMSDISVYGTSSSWKAYSMTDAKYLSFSDSVLSTSPFNNPQNYAWYMLARYVIKQYDWYPSDNIWTTKQDPPNAPRRPNIFNTSDASAAAAKSCRPTVLSANPTASSTSSSLASSSATCVVPDGCSNALAPTGCAVLCT